MSVSGQRDDSGLKLLRAISAAAILEEVDIDLSLPLEQQVGCPAARTETWIAVFNELNARVLLEGQFGRRKVVVPPCLVLSDLLVPVEGGSREDLRQQYRLFNGKEPSPADLTAIVSVGDKTYIPQTRAVASIRVSSTRMKEVQALTSSSITVSGTSDFQLVTAGADLTSCDGAATNWPFNAGAVVGVLTRNAAQRRESRPRLTAIGVVDTGISRDEKRLLLNVSEPEDGGRPNWDDDKSEIKDDVFGATLPGSRGDPTSPPLDVFTDAGHGTHVAGLALGGLSSTALNKLLDGRLSVRAISVLQCVGDAVSSPICGIPSTVLGQAIRYAARRTERAPETIKVLNISLESSLPDSDHRSEIFQHQILIVVAAGNRGKPLDDYESYPARYGVNPEQALIVVAAHDAKGALAPFSNWGTGVVDLAAPGCSVDSLEIGGGRGVRSGTSQAAPLVSFTAGLLVSEGLSPLEAKHRILATVDKTDALRDKVRTGGMLNIARALSIYDDIVELNDGGAVHGTLIGCINAGGDCIPWEEISRLDTTDTPKEAVITRLLQNLYTGTRRVPSDAVVVKLRVDNREVSYKGSEVRVVWPRMRRPSAQGR